MTRIVRKGWLGISVRILQQRITVFFTSASDAATVPGAVEDKTENVEHKETSLEVGREEGLVVRHLLENEARQLGGEYL